MRNPWDLKGTPFSDKPTLLKREHSSLGIIPPCHCWLHLPLIASVSHVAECPTFCWSISPRRAAQVSTVAGSYKSRRWNHFNFIQFCLLVLLLNGWNLHFNEIPFLLVNLPFFCCFKLQIPLEPLGCPGWHQIHSSFSSITLLSTSCRAKTLTSATPPKRVATGWGLSPFMLVAWLYCGYSIYYFWISRCINEYPIINHTWYFTMVNEIFHHIFVHEISHHSWCLAILNAAVVTTTSTLCLRSSDLLRRRLSRSSPAHAAALPPGACGNQTP